MEILGITTRFLFIGSTLRILRINKTTTRADLFVRIYERCYGLLYMQVTSIHCVYL